MFFRQMLDQANGCASYLIGCTGTAEAVVVDPLATVGAEEYVLAAADQGLRVVRVVDTHLHADHVSAARDLAEASGARLHMHEAAETRFPFDPLRDGDTLTLGAVRLEVLHTPGHTPESVSLLVYDGARSAQAPWLVLTGDSLLVGDVARPDLVLDDVPDPAAVDARARALHRSLRRLSELPDGVEVFPGHFGASACGGRHLSSKPSSTIGFERLTNGGLTAGGEDAFVRFVLGGLRPQPERYQEVKMGNMGAPAAAARG